MSMSKSNSKGKSLGPLFRKKGEGGLKAFEFEIQSGSYLNSGGWARSSQAIQPGDVCIYCIHLSVVL